MGGRIALAILALAVAGQEASSTAVAIETSQTINVHATFTDVRYQGAPGPQQSNPVPRDMYRNPVLAGSMSDPSILRVGTDYYLVTSSFIFWPGLPIFHSRNLVDWDQVGAAISLPEQLQMHGLDTWQGVYAPDLQWHDGRFYLTSTCYGCGGNFILTAARAEGPWSKPVWLPFDGIDPSLFFDDDGHAYVVNNGLPPGGAQWSGHRAIWLQEIDLSTLTMKGERTMLVNGGAGDESQPFWIEGPRLVRRGREYILICAQGGTKETHHEVAFRSDTLQGPYVARAEPILDQNGLDPSRPNRVVEAGHADLVQTQTGDWWAVFLASRPFGPQRLDYTTGRETYLLPVTWRDGWPVILPRNEAVPALSRRPALPVTPRGTASAAGGGTNSPQWHKGQLDPPWGMLGSPAAKWWHAQHGSLRLDATSPALGGTEQPALLAMRQPDPLAVFEARVRLSAGASGSAGITAYAGTHFYWALLIANLPDGKREVRVVRRTSDGDPEAGTMIVRAPIKSTGLVRLRIVAEAAELRFYFAQERSKFHPLGEPQDGLSLAVSNTGGFTGTLLGMVALEN